MSCLVILRRCTTVEEALVVDSLLKDGGFLSSVGEYHIGTIQWDTIAAFGGISVWIPEDEMFRAGQYLIEMQASAQERLRHIFGDIDPSPLKLRWGRAWSMIFIYFGGSVLIWYPIAWIMAQLPVDWYAFANRPVLGYLDPIATGSNRSITNQTIPQSEGVLFLLIIVIFLVFEFTALSDKRRTSRPRPEERP